MNIVETICQEIDSFRGLITKDELIQIIYFCNDIIVERNSEDKRLLEDLIFVYDENDTDISFHLGEEP